MTPVIGLNENELNEWYFSPCSVRNFLRYIFVGGKIRSTFQCILNKPSNLLPENNYNIQPYMTGQLWNADQQCQIAFNLPDSNAASCDVTIKFSF